MTIEELFKQAENGTLTFEQFTKLAGTAKFVDLTDGEYVSKNKYTEDLQKKDTEIEGLKTTISTRDADLKDLKKQLKDAGTDAEKLSKVSGDLESLQAKYDTDTKELQQKLEQQAYEFAVKEFANTQKFTSNAARRDFINSMIQAQLSWNKDKTAIEGTEDFTKEYKTANADAFAVESDPTPTPQHAPTPQPQFAGATNGGGGGQKMSLSEMMKMKNENPNATFNF